MKKYTLKKILKTLLIIFLVFSVISFISLKTGFYFMFHRVNVPKYSMYFKYEDIKDNYKRKSVHFMSGKNKLRGDIYGIGNKKGLIVISHGHNRGAERYLSETMYFVDNGYMVFAFDDTGCYRSEGKNSVGISQPTLDLDNALNYIEKQSEFKNLPILLYGHSQGGYAVTSVLNYNHDIAAVVSISGFNKPVKMILEWGKNNILGNFMYLEAPYVYIYQKILFGRDALLSAVNGINKSDIPVLIVHGTGDKIIGYDTSAIIAYKNYIKNSNVKYITRDRKGQNGHSNLVKSMKANRYTSKTVKEYKKIMEKYDKKVPKKTEEAFYKKIDKYKSNELDESFMKKILDFYERAI